MEVREARVEGEEKEGIIMGKIKIEEEIWKLGLVQEDMDRKLKELKNWMEMKREDKMIIEGNFNVRTDEEGESRGRMDGEKELQGRKDRRGLEEAAGGDRRGRDGNF